MSASIPAYSVEQLEPGSFEVLLDASPVPVLVQGLDGLDDGWRVDLLDEALASDRPLPCTGPSHTFGSLPAALDWVGVHRRGIVDARSG